MKLVKFWLVEPFNFLKVYLTKFDFTNKARFCNLNIVYRLPVPYEFTMSFQTNSSTYQNEISLQTYLSSCQILHYLSIYILRLWLCTNVPRVPKRTTENCKMQLIVINMTNNNRNENHQNLYTWHLHILSL